ncbi:DUF58 domain-containing protein [Amnibacterium kyonggiense]|uniref:Uncharacterized protein (DUF58 family) n=1 Tax=Amnibacterium kyonggiense TaxID=595671 RepID=A0A4R7FFC6_9MICO|nr:DUF58 domain-containing protein [Amnibacterium kyonggiense]TDS74823.1 uncharacterized protein (DUF58 family) [Amnibacterium kyonggiense]
MVITGRVPLLLLIGGVPLVLLGSSGAGWAIGVLLAWLGLVVLLVVIDVAAAASPRQVRLQRELPNAVRLGEPTEATLLVTNPGTRRIRGLLRDAWQPSAGATPTRWPLDLPGGERRAFRAALVPVRRGERRAEQVTVRSLGPLGVAGRQATLRAPGAIRVLPPFRSRRHLPSRLARLRELDGRTLLQVRGQGTEFDSLREYVRGDDVRSIDWRATARNPALPGAGQRLMVRTWRPERDRRVVVVVDSGRTAAARIADEPRLDTAFESTLLLTALATRGGDRVDLLIWDRRVRARVHAAAPADVLHRMVDAMAPIDPELLETDWSGVPAQVRALTSQRALVVIVTSLEGAGSARGLLTMLPQLTSRHLVVIASVTDPAVAAMTTERHDLDETYLAAAAERTLLDTDRIGAAAARLGAQVVTAPPADLPPALADRYLALKAAGRL